MKKTVKIRLIRAIVLIFTVATVSLLCNKTASAFNCTSSEGVRIRADNSSIDRACKLFNGSTARGAMWVAKKNNKLVDTIKLTEDESKKKIVKNVYLYGSVLDSYDSRTYYGSHVYILTSSVGSHQSDSTLKKKVFSPIKFKKHTMYRGKGRNTHPASFSKGWEKGGIKLTIDVKAFMKAADSVKKYTNFTRYTKHVHVYRCFGSSYSGRPGSCYSDESTIKLDIIDVPEEEDVEFKARSKVYDSGWSSKDGGGEISPTSGKAKTKLDLEGSSSTATTKVTFKHKIYTTKKSVYKTYNPDTTWTVTQTKNGGGETKVASQKIDVKGLSKTGDKTYYEVVSKNSVTVTLRPGERVTICQTIKYSKKTFTFDMETKKQKSSKGSNDSEACVTISYKYVEEYCPDGTDATINYGNTTAKSEVRKYSNGGDWTTGTILAKPGEEIRFRHTLCFGAQAVESSGNENSSYRRPSSSFSYFPANTFRLTSERKTPDYLFDRRTLASTQTIPKAQRRPFTKGRPPVNPDSVKDWGIRIYSPSSPGANLGAGETYDTNEFNCNTALASSWIGLGTHRSAYQIPGFDTYSNINDCNSKNLAVGGSDVGSTISQTIHYKNIKAWIQYKSSRYYASCGCATDNWATPQYLGSYEYAKSASGVWGYAYETCRKSGRCDYSCNCSTCGNAKDGYYPCNCSPCSDSYTSRGDHRGVYFNLALSVYDDSRTASVKVPYNFRTKASSKITNGDDDSPIVYAGETVGSQFSVKELARENEAVAQGSYMTVMPKSTRVEIIAFTISPDAALNKDVLSGGITSMNPCDYFRSHFVGTICGPLTDTNNRRAVFVSNDSGGAFNANGNLDGTFELLKDGVVNKDNDGMGEGVQRTDTVPDVEAGSKYCVAVGINHADSHGYPFSKLDASVAANSTSMGDTNPNWRISNASCRTIAKKPNFQVWGGIYTQGNIATSTSPKVVGKVAGKIATAENPTRIFGSWSDMLAIGNGTIAGFTSASGLGYIGDKGGASGNNIYCRFVKMSIANTECSNDNTTGQAAINISSSQALNQILSRYTPADRTSTTRPDKFDVSTQALTDDIKVLNNGGYYTYVDGDARISAAPLLQSSGTRVIEVSGTIYIDQNICSGSGTCLNTGSNRLVLKERNSQPYGDIESIPQVIIIAKNIYIGSEVTQIDAWLFTRDDGASPDDARVNVNSIDTCYNYDTVDLSTDACNKTLIFNGPVFTKNINLKRTAGAYPGANTIGRAMATRDLASNLTYNAFEQKTGGRGLSSGYALPAGYGSITPAEIFNLRPDAYMWAYNQANHLSQATVVYMRELAPRY